MKKTLFIATLLMNIIAIQANAQCSETYNLCAKQFSKEDKNQDWNTNQQSESVSVEKGTVYETSVSAYKGMEYRLSVCTDVAGGTAAKFQLSQDVMNTIENEDGTTSIQKQRVILFDNNTDNADFYVLFRSNKTEKFYITVTIPTLGKSKNKKLKSPDYVCLGLLLEHRKVKASSL